MGGGSGTLCIIFAMFVSIRLVQNKELKKEREEEKEKGGKKGKKGGRK